MVGPLANVRGHASNIGGAYDVEDNVVMAFTLQPPGQATPALGTATWNFTGFGNEEMITIRGDKGVLRLSTFGTEPMELTTVEGTTKFTFEPPFHVQQPLIQMIVDDLRKVGPSAPSKGENALRVAQALDAALTDFYGGRQDTFWDRADTWPGKKNKSTTETKSGEAGDVNTEIVEKAKAHLRELYQRFGVDDTHGMHHVLKVLGHLDNALAAAPHPERISPSRNLSCRLAALLHDADDKKYFPDTYKTCGNAKTICRQSGATEEVVQEVVQMIGWVSCSKNGKPMALATANNAIAT